LEELELLRLSSLRSDQIASPPVLQQLKRLTLSSSLLQVTRVIAAPNLIEVVLHCEDLLNSDSMAHLLRVSPKIRCVALSSFLFQGLSLKAILESSVVYGLESFSLMWPNSTEDQVIQLSTYSTSLKRLHLSGVHFTLAAYLLILRNLPQLQELTLHNCSSIGPEFFGVLPSLSQNLLHVAISGICFTVYETYKLREWFPAASKLFQGHSKLRTLQLENHHITRRNVSVLLPH
jgi:Leucine-rich repeat (LRR) protein